MMEVYTIKRKTKKFLKIIKLVLMIFLIYIFYVMYSIVSYGNADETKKADAAIILGAGTTQGTPSSVFEERIKHGIWLYNNNYVDKLIFTGGTGEGNDYSDAYIAYEYAIEHGIPKEKIFMEEQSRITSENLYYAMTIMTEYDINTVLIVSDPLHMKRAMLMAQDYQLNAYSSPTLTTRYISFRTKVPFLIRETIFYIGYKCYRIF